MKRTLLILFIILIQSVAFGQKRLEIANDLFSKQNYVEALKAYQSIIKREKSPDRKKYVSFQMGECYRHLLNYKDAKQWYSNAINFGYEDPIVFLHMGDMLLGLEEFNTSISYFQKYLERNPDDPMAQKKLQSAQFSNENYKKESLFIIQDEATLNSEFQEWGIAYLENVAKFFGTDKKAVERYNLQFDIETKLFNSQLFYYAIQSKTLKERIVFASTKSYGGKVDKRTGEGYSNIYQSILDKKTQQWELPGELSDKINSDYYDGFFSYDKANKIAYFMNCGGTRGTRSSCDIYFSIHNTESDTWSDPEIFPFNSDAYDVGYPSISDDGKTLFFASDMPGGLGGYDLYKIEKTEEGWGTPQNLGDTINTSYNDAYPYVMGNILYFSSFGHTGMGGFDVFYTIMDTITGFSKPVNMGIPINSSADDFSFVINESYSRGYFSSNRPGGKGSDDIFSFRIASKIFTLKGLITDNYTGSGISDITITLSGEDGSFALITSNDNGEYIIPSLSSDVNYTVEASKEGYNPVTQTLSVKDKLFASQFTVSSDHTLDFVMEPVTPKQNGDSKETPVEQGEQLAEKTEPVIPVDTKTQEVKTQEVKTEIPTHPTRWEEDEETDLPDYKESNNLNLTDFSGYQLPMLFFDFSKWSLRNSSMMKLDTVAAFMKNNPSLCLVVHAHTDIVSSIEFNFYLSQRRAQSIIEYLVEKGISEDRLYPLAHGKQKLLIPNAKTVDEHQMNRRGHFQTIPQGDFQDFFNQASRHSFRYLNSLEKTAHREEGVEFMVQFIAAKTPINPQYYQKIIQAFPRLNIIYYYDVDKFHRYSVGSFKSFKAAYEVQKAIREMGYQTYVVAFHNGEKIHIAQAQKILSN